MRKKRISKKVSSIKKSILTGKKDIIAATNEPVKVESSNEPVDKKVRSFPMGMILLLIVIGFEILNYIQKYSDPIAQLGPVILTKISAILFITVNIVLLLIIFYGIIKKYNWSRNLGMIYYCFWLVLGIFNIIFFLLNPLMYNSYILKTVPSNLSPQMVSGIIFFTLLTIMVLDEILSLIIVLYLLKRKEYFTK